MSEINIEGYLLNVLKNKANNTLSNVTAAAAANLNAVGARTVSGAWASGNSWLRVYSDGFIIQGGLMLPNVTSAAAQVISFHQAFTTTSYTCFVNISFLNGQEALPQINITGRYTTYFTTQYTCNKYWVAFGY